MQKAALVVIVAVAVAAIVSLFGSDGGVGAQETPPAASTDLQAIAYADAIGISLQWRDNSDNEESWIVERSEIGPQGPWTLIATLPADTCPRFPPGRRCYDDWVELEPGADYWYRVAAVNAAGRSEYSNVSWAEAGTSILPTAPPDETPTPGVVLPETGGGVPSSSNGWLYGLVIGLLFVAGSLGLIQLRSGRVSREQAHDV